LRPRPASTLAHVPAKPEGANGRLAGYGQIKQRAGEMTRINPKQAALAIFAIAAATLIGAWIFQYGFSILPCPLCLEQRYAYYLIIPLAFILALVIGRAPPALVILGFLILALAALANAVLGAYHSGVEWGFWPGPQECSGALNPLGQGGGSLLQSLDQVKVIRCDEVQWRFLGLSLAGYNVLISALMALIALCGVRFSYGSSSVSQ